MTEGLGLAAEVMLDAEVLHLHPERQRLHQVAVPQPQESQLRGTALGDGDRAAEGRVLNRQPAFPWHLGGGDVPGLDLDLAAAFLQLQRHIAVH